MALNLLLVFIPIAVGLDWYGTNPVMVFAAKTPSETSGVSAVQ